MVAPADRSPAEPLRVAEILVPLSLVTDLGMGAPDEQAMRACLLATALARRMGVSDAEVADVYYTTLLEHLGCTATALEESRHAAGDELAARSHISHADFGRPSEVLGLLGSVGRGRGPVARARAIGGALAGFRWGPPVQAAVCEVASLLAARLGMRPGVQEALGQIFERWDGKGEPRHLRGEAIALPARFAHVATRAIAFYALDGLEAARAAVRNRSGGWLDPEIAGAFESHAAELLAELEESDVLTATLEAEPEPRLLVTGGGLDDATRAFADMVDLQTPFTLGHSSGVAELSTGAAGNMGLSARECVALRRAGMLHDLGRVAVPAGTWAKRGTLSAAERERIRLHTYYTERILSRAPRLADEAAIAGLHHERLDGTGYHRAATGRALSMPARILAAADAYQAWTQERPHRPAATNDEAAARLIEEARAGKFDAQAVEAVLAAAGDPRRVRALDAPAGLTEREIEVLRLLASGLSNAEIAERLVISRRTAEHHVQHIYAKIGVSTRPGATLFALEHDLLIR